MASAVTVISRSAICVPRPRAVLATSRAGSTAGTYRRCEPVNGPHTLTSGATPAAARWPSPRSARRPSRARPPRPRVVGVPVACATGRGSSSLVSAMMTASLSPREWWIFTVIAVRSPQALGISQISQGLRNGSHCREKKLSTTPPTVQGFPSCPHLTSRTRRPMSMSSSATQRARRHRPGAGSRR